MSEYNGISLPGLDAWIEREPYDGELGLTPNADCCQCGDAFYISRVERENNPGSVLCDRCTNERDARRGL